MPDDNKTTNTNQPVTEEVPTVGPSNPTTTSATPASDTSSPTTDAPPPPMQDGAFSPPPPIVEEKKPKETATTTQETGSTDSAQTIPDIPPVISTSGTEGKTPVSKKMIATILGILFLVGGIGAGVILVQNQQDIREKAVQIGDSCIKDFECTDKAGGKCVDGTCIYPKSTPTPPPIPTSSPKIIRGGFPGDKCSLVSPATGKIIHGTCMEPKDCAGNQWHTEQKVCQAAGNELLGCCIVSGTPSPTAAPTLKPTAKPTLPPEIDCSCLTIKAFDEEWTAITNLSSLSAGDVVRFTVSGKTNSGSIDKARFTINGTLRPGVTVKRPNTKEFYDEYTIPESVSTFTINAELRHTALGWF